MQHIINASQMQLAKSDERNKVKEKKYADILSFYRNYLLLSERNHKCHFVLY